MLPKCLPNVRRAISDPRLDAYRLAPPEDELDLLARYAWNMALGAALYTPLHLLEVALRNTLYTALVHQHSGNPRWYQQQHAFRTQGSWDKVQEALQKVSRVTNPAAPDAPGRIVAELDFGFWTSLLSSRYGSPPSKHENWRPLWPALFPLAFPAFPNPTGTKRDRETLAERFDNIRQLRNRVSHHEPIWKGRPGAKTKSRVTLAMQYQEILDALGWISPDVVHVANALCNFPQVYNQGMAPYRLALQKLP